MQQEYLRRLQEEAGHLSLLHIDSNEAERRMELARVYTALLTVGGEDRQPERMLAAAPNSQPPPPVSALAQLNRHKRLVILGGPGSGKSVFINFAALCMAGELLAGDGQALALFRTPLPPDEDDDSGRKEEEPELLPWGHGPLLPIKVVLRKFAAEGLPPPGQPATIKHLWDYLERQLASEDLPGCVSGVLKERCRSRHSRQGRQGALLLFDGLDELPDPEQRGPQIRQVIEDAAARYPNCRIVVTSRPYAYQNPKWQLRHFAVAVLAPFNKAQIAQFIDRWYAYLGSLHRWDAGERGRRTERLKRAIFIRPQLRVLAERPLLLTLMSNLHASRGALPEKRAELYDETVKLLLDWWERGRFSADKTVVSPRLSEWLEVEQSKIRGLLQELAYDAHKNQPARAAGTANLDQAKLLNGLLNLTPKGINPDALLDYLEQRAGILEARGERVYRFPHRTFQEYLAACYLADTDYPDKIAGLARSDPDRWREVALLAGAEARKPFAIWALADALRSPNKPPESGKTLKREDDARFEADCRGALLAGKLIEETLGLKQVSPRYRPNLAEIRLWLPAIIQRGRLPPAERESAGQMLAVLGDNRPGVGLHPNGLPDIDWLEIPAGEFWMGDGKERHKLVLPDYRIARYPLTNAQYQPFIDDGGYRQKRWWTEAGWKAKDNSGWTEPRLWRNSRFNRPNQPVVGISWHEAVAYCRWLTAQLAASQSKIQNRKSKIRLPSEAEWEKAARGTDGRPYPWGNDWDKTQCNNKELGWGEPSTVGIFPGGAAPGGCMDMAGNVWEWCATKQEKNYSPYNVKENEWADSYLEEADWRRLRGGAYYNDQESAGCGARNWYVPDSGIDVGFRPVVSPSLPSAL